ncbi:Alpha/Beta hydrolase protein [Dactylonectria estremocensis]|uniref:Alpha/Beta hydrolase protein n=1 Tax=Dactylonectria estremocensis TaxID=1079267 RepID=A0A9P9JKA4_9HYPO|nr:Alpha/Beta hydrolase protein [Dactylonectria estremocensis]
MYGELRYDPEYLTAISAHVFSGQPRPSFENVFAVREFTEHILHAVLRLEPTPAHIIETKVPFKSHDGTTVNLHRFANTETIEASMPQPSVIYVHGGGMAANMGMPFFVVDYRLAPEHPGPGSIEDVFFGLKHLSEHAAVDPARIAIMGDSGGGGLGAGAALMARDRELRPALAKQVLVYPMLDDRAQLPPGSPLEKLLMRESKDIRLAWSAVLGEDRAGREGADVSEYMAPGRAEDLSGLPSTSVEVGGLDLFRDETIAYVSRLTAAHVETEFHLWPGLPHGFDGVAQLSWTKKAFEARARALRSF